MNVPRCDDPNHCITCSDEGVPMRVVSHDDDRMLARCEDERGAQSDVLTALIEELRIGDTLLVHAGTALLRLAS
jgi:hydrogenase maturation factor